MVGGGVQGTDRVRIGSLGSGSGIEGQHLLSDGSGGVEVKTSQSQNSDPHSTKEGGD